MTLPSGEKVDRFPAYTLRATQSHDPEEIFFRARMASLPPRYTRARIAPPKAMRIYEAHIGASAPSSSASHGTFASFQRDVLPHVKRKGYNTLQLFGCFEHPYYASYGYQVSNFFAVSSRFGQLPFLSSNLNV